MRKQWIKREQLFEKPFYKQKLKMTFLGVFVMALIFFAYQLFYIKQLQKEIEHKPAVVHYSKDTAENELFEHTERGKRRRILR